MKTDNLAIRADAARELESLKEDFTTRIATSNDKWVLRSREIKGHSLIFDDEKLPISATSDDDEPLVEFSIEISSMDIFLIREFYFRFIVGHHDISELEGNLWDPWYSKLNDFTSEYIPDRRYFYDRAVKHLRYIEWLRQYKIIRMSLPVQALIKVYEGEILERNNSKLYQHWAKYSKRLNRTGAEDTKTKNKNKITLLEKVIDNLSGEAKSNAEKELDELKMNIDNQGFGI